MSAMRTHPICARCVNFQPGYTAVRAFCIYFGSATGATSRACKRFRDKRADQLDLFDERDDSRAND